MSTTRDFSAMLNEHLPYELLKGEMIERSWLMNYCEKDDEWLGGNLVVPFRGGKASTVTFGSLAGSTDIAASTYVRGNVANYKEVWGSLYFYETDLMQHGKISEQNFLKLLPNEIDGFMKTMKERVSCVALNGYADKAISTYVGANDGLITVNHPERFEIGEKVFVKDDDSAQTAASYVTAINQATGVLTLKDARSSGAVVNLTNYTGAANAKVYYDGTDPSTNAGFTSLRNQILSAADGGGTTLFGQTKTAYPYLQSIGQSGSLFTENNFLEGLFNKYITIRNRCSGNPRNIVMSYKNFGAALKNIQVSKGPFNVIPDSRKASVYGWDELTIAGFAGGSLKLVAVQEMEDDVVYYLSDKGIKFHSNGFFRRRVAPDGKSFYEVRATTGYTYIVDISCFGELVLYEPSAQGYVSGINFALSET